MPEKVIKEKMLQVPIRIDILDKVEGYIDGFNRKGMALYKLKKSQLVAEALLEYMANNPLVK